MVFVLTPDKQKILQRRVESLAVFISFWSTHLSLERGQVGVIKYDRELTSKTILPLPVLSPGTAWRPRHVTTRTPGCDITQLATD